MNDRRHISVFIASPGDLAPERKAFKDTIDALNVGFADGAGVTFVPLGWEDLKAQTGRRTQAIINLEIQKSDIFILALHHRWGQKAPDSKFSSYTEEEFNLALGLWKKKKSPEVLVFFKNVDRAYLADPGPELTKVLSFRKKLENGRAILIRNFNNEVEFGQEIDRHLRAFARGEWDALRAELPGIKLSRFQVAALSKAERAGKKRIEQVQKRQTKGQTRSKEVVAAAKADLSLVKVHQTELALCRAAVDASGKGLIQDASVLFAKATEGTTDLSILSLAEEFFQQINDLDSASALVQRRAAIARDVNIAADYYLALIPQGLASGMIEQLAVQMFAELPEEIGGEIRSILDEIYGGGRFNKLMREILAQHYSEGELVQLARFAASPEGQSSLHKQPLILKESMEMGQREFARLLLKRRPDLVADFGAPQAQVAPSLPGPRIGNGGNNPAPPVA
jgi:hypothetical protein